MCQVILQKGDGDDQDGLFKSSLAVPFVEDSTVWPSGGELLVSDRTRLYPC